MWDVFFYNLLCHGHDLCYSSLIVCAEKSGTVSGDQGSSLQICQMWEILEGKGVFAFSKLYIGSIIVRDNLGIHILPGKIRCSIHVGNEADCRLVLKACCRRDDSIDIAFVINAHILYSNTFQLLCQLISKIKLAAGRWHYFLLILTCGIYLYIIQQSFVCTHFDFSFFILNYPFRAFIVIRFTTPQRQKRTCLLQFFQLRKLAAK